MESKDDLFSRNAKNSIKEAVTKKDNLSLSLIKEKAASFIFSVINKAFPKSSEQPEKFTALLYSHILIFLESIQVLALLWYNQESTQGWGNFKYFWKALSFARLENFCTSFSFISNCFYISISTVGFLTLIISVIIVNYIKDSEKNKLSSLFRKIFTLLSTVLYVPIMTIQLVILKHYIKGSDFILEYNQPNPSLNLAFPILAGFSSAFLYGSGYIYNALVFESRHCFYFTSPFARAHSKLEIMKFQFITLMVVSYALYSDSHQDIFRCLACIGSFYTALNYFWLRPFYWNHINAAKITGFVLIASVSGILELSSISNNANYAFFLTVFAVPIFLVIVYYTSLEKLNNNTLKIDSATSCFLFEISLRKKLIHTEDTDSVLNHFFKCYEKCSFGKEPLMIIWLSNFCFYNINNYSLARIKLGLETKCDYGLDTEFQVFKLRKAFDNETLDYHEDIDFLNFRQKFEKLQLDDENLCASLIEFLKIVEIGTDLSQLLSENIPDISDLLTSVTSQYTSLVRQYPRSYALIHLYSTFLESIANDEEKANEYSRKKNNIELKKGFGMGQSISYFDDENGLMLISGALDNFAIITYANKGVQKILNQPLHCIIGNNISVYIPYPFNINHDNHMKRYILKCLRPEIELPLKLFLQNEKGFLIECYVQVKCTALDKSPFFLVLLRESSSEREIAILSPAGLVLNHTERLGFFLGIPNEIIKDRFIDDYLEGYMFSKMAENIPYVIKRNNVAVAAIKTYKIIKKKKIDLIYFIKDQKEIARWRKGQVSKESEYDSNQKLDSTDFLSTTNFKNIERLTTESNYLLRKDSDVKASTQIHFKDDLTYGSKYSKSQGIKAPSIAPRTIGSTSNSNTNTFSSSPKFDQAFSLITRLKWSAFFVIIINVSLKFACFLVIANTHDIAVFDDMKVIGNTGNILADVAYVSRSIQLGKKDPFYDLKNEEAISNLIANLTSINNAFRKMYLNTDCPLNEIFPPSIDYNSLSPLPNNIIEIINSIKQKMVDILNRNRTEDNFKYVTINSLLVTENLIRSYLKMKDCKENILRNKIHTRKFYLLPSVICTTISVFIFIYGSARLASVYKDLWGLFCKLANTHLADLWKKVVDRLIDVHNKVEYRSMNSNELGEVKKTRKKYSTNSYGWRLAVYIVIYLSTFFWMFYYFMPKLQVAVHTQPVAFSSTYSASIYAMLLRFWVREKILQDPFQDVLGDKTVLLMSGENIEGTLENLRSSQRFFAKFMQMKEFGSTSIYNNLLKQDALGNGQYFLLNEIMVDSYDIDLNSSNDILFDFKKKVDLYSDNVQTILNYVSNDIPYYLHKENKIVLVFLLCYFFMEMLLYSYLFISIISDDFKKISCIKNIGVIIPVKSIK